MKNGCSLTENPPRDAYFLPALNHVLDVLDFLYAHQEPATVTEVAAGVGIVKSAAYRILHNLANRGYVEKDEARHSYSLGIRLWELGSALTSISALRDGAEGTLAALTARTGETTHLAILDQSYVIYIDKAETPSSVRAYAEIGDRAPAHAVATGKVLLAALARYRLALAVRFPLPRYSATTITGETELETELERVRADGFAINDGEWRDEVVGIAVPVRVDSRHEVALGIAGPRYRFSPTVARRRLPELRAAGEELGRALSPAARALATAGHRPGGEPERLPGAAEDHFPHQQGHTFPH